VRLASVLETGVNVKAEIADVAARLFAERGYHATSIQDLSDATGLQRGALYHYIEKKRDLLYSIHERFIDPLLAEAREIEARQEPPDVAIMELAHALMNVISTYHDQVTVFLHEWNTIADEPEWKEVRKSRREFEAIIQRVVERGVSEGMFKIDDVRLATLAFIGMINYSYQWYRPGGRANPDRVADVFGSIFLNGVTG
jgi:AcrR family transcriptional regulator